MAEPKFEVTREYRVGQFNPANAGKKTNEETRAFTDLEEAKRHAKAVEKELGGLVIVAEYSTKIVARYGTVPRKKT